MQNHGPDIAWVDTNDVCQLTCPTCVRGARGMQNSSSAMNLDTFAAIVGRLREQGFHRIGLYNWTEPFLNRSIHEFVRIAKETDLHVCLSSTLSLRHIDHLEATLTAGLDILTVSVSGIDQETYQINHAGGEIAYVFRNFGIVREIIIRHSLSTRVDLRFLKFPYNADQAAPLQAYAERMGFKFEIVKGVGDPMSSRLQKYDNEYYRRAASAASISLSPEDQGKSCELMFNQIAIDCRGDVHICCAMPNFPSLRIGKFLNMTADDILAAKFTHEFCRACTMPRRNRTEAERVRLNDLWTAGKLPNHLHEPARWLPSRGRSLCRQNSDSSR